MPKAPLGQLDTAREDGEWGRMKMGEDRWLRLQDVQGIKGPMGLTA